jgi:glycosyltransferase involved in cell wall biosynthesis
MSRVDVIVPCYNYGRYLRQSVESVLAQEGVDVHVLIIDDCSADDSEAVGRRLAAEDPRVEYWRHASNQGHIATYNEGIDWLAGDYCLLLSADDLLVPGALVRATALMDARLDVVLTHGLCVWTADPHKVGALEMTPAATVQNGLEFIRIRCKAAQNLVETPTAIGRTAVQKAIGHYRADLPHTADMFMWLEYATHGAVAYLHAHQAIYRTHGQNMSVRYRGVRDLEHLKLTFDLFFAGPGAGLTGCADLKRTAYRGIARQAFDGAYQAFQTGDSRLATQFTCLARSVDAGTRFERRWVALRGKRLIGPRVWNGFRKVRRSFAWGGG